MYGEKQSSTRTSISVSATSIGRLVSNILLPRCKVFFDKGADFPFKVVEPLDPLDVRQAGAT